MTELLTAEARSTRIHASVVEANAKVSQKQGEVRATKWKNEVINLPVAVVDLDVVLLNPFSHRIRAQLESLPTATRAVVESDPYGTESQELIAKILMETEGYERIRNALNRDGQTEPGVLTDAGVLINANTRAVALRELRAGYIKVTVLPADATTKELTDLELQLQMEVDVKQTYTLTSQLLFIEELIENGRTAAEIGRALRRDFTDSASDQKKSKELVDQQLRLLSLIREVQRASSGQLTFVYFDDKRQALIEIDDDYQGLKNSKPSDAIRVRDAQLAALLSGIDYRKLREIDRQLLDDYLEPAMKEESVLAPFVGELLAAHAAGDPDSIPDGLDLFDDFEPTDNGVSLSHVYALIASTEEDGIISFGTGDSTLEINRQGLIASVNGAIRVAINTRLLDTRAGNALDAPRNYLREVARALDKTKDAYEEVATNPAFDRDTFAAAYEEYERAATELEDLVGPDMKRE